MSKTEFTGTLLKERALAEYEILMKENLKGCQNYLIKKTDNDLQESIEFMSA